MLWWLAIFACMQQEPPPSSLSLAEVARLLAYRDKGTLRRLIHTGQLQAFRAWTPSGKGAWRVTATSVAAFIARAGQAGTRASEINSLKVNDLGDKSSISGIPDQQASEMKSLQDNDLHAKNSISDKISGVDFLV